MAKSSPKKKIVKKSSATTSSASSPLKISTSLFQRNSRNSTGSRRAGSSSTTTTMMNSSSKKAAAKLAAARQSKAKAESKASSQKKTAPSSGSAGSSKKVQAKSSSPPKKSSSESKADAKSKRTLSNASSASSSTSSKAKGKQVTSKTPPGKRKKEEAAVKVVKAKQVERSLSVASTTTPSRRTSTNVSPPPKGRAKETATKQQPSVKREISSPSRSPSPRLRSSSSSNQVKKRTRSQSGSSSFPGSPLSSTSAASSATSSSGGSSSSSSSSSSSASPPPQRKKKKVVKRLSKVVAAKKIAAQDGKKKSRADDKKKGPSKKEPPAPPKKTRSSSGDSSKSFRAIGRRTVRSASSSSTTKQVASKKPDRVIAKKITKKAIIKAKKPKPKPKLKVRPKLKKRMASLNATAILEASFSFEAEKKVKSTPSPKISKQQQQQQHSSESAQDQAGKKEIPREIKDFENLLADVKIEVRSGPPPSYAKSSSPEKVAAKRKSNSSEQNRKDEPKKSVASAGTSPLYRRSSEGKKSNEKAGQASQSQQTQSTPQPPRKSKSPVPRKKTKVATAETSTSTPAWNWDPGLYQQQQQQHHSIPYGSYEQQQQQYLNELPHRQERADYGTQMGGNKQKSQGCQAKADSPAVVAGRTIYQPAGPLIEPHKNPSSSAAIAAVPGGFHIPDSVRLPPDLKVTYQTHPPATNLPPPSAPVAVAAAAVVHQSSNKQSSKSHKSSKILHQPYKTASSSTNTGPSTNTASVGTQQRSNSSSTSSTQRQSQSLPSASSTSSLESGGFLNPAAHQQPQQLPASLGSHTAMAVMSGAAAAAAAAAGAAPMYYPSFAPPPPHHHHSPFTPNKFPIVPPDSFRSPSPYAPSFLYTPQAPGAAAGASAAGNFYMTPFYTPPITPTSATILGTPGQSRAMPHPSIAAASSAIYQSNHQQGSSANYLVPSSPSSVALPSHHSVSSQSSPGHAGHFRPNPSSPPACPTDSYPQAQPRSNNSSKSTIISSSSNNNNNKPPQQRHSATPAIPSDLPEVSLKPLRKKVLPPAPPEIPKTDAKVPKSADDSPKVSFSEQYSLPDDITITPILVPHGTPTAGLPTTASVPKVSSTKEAETPPPVPVVTKPKDVVHVINPRSGTTTTIAKHMSNSAAAQVPVKNVSPVKPNNAVSVGKINPDLDVIVIGRRPVVAPIQSRTACVNVVQPEVRSSEPAQKRKGLQECVDGLQKKRIKEAEAAAAATTTTSARTTAISARTTTIPERTTTISARTATISTAKATTMTPARTTAMTPARSMSTAKFNGRRKSASPTAARALPREQVFEMRNSTIVNEREAVAAASALVVPSNRIRLSPHKNGLKRGLGLPGSKAVTTRSSTANAKIKTRSSAKDVPIYNSRAQARLRRVLPRRGGGPLTISTNGRLKSRSPMMMGSPSSSSSSSSGQFILRIPRVGLSNSDDHHHHHQSSSHYSSDAPSRSLLVPAATSLRNQHHHHDVGGRYVDYALPVGRQYVVGESSGKYKAQIAGSMAFSALKKRAIVKPLSPNVMNGALHSMMLMAKRSPRWSNGWRWEGEPFEAKVYLTNDDTPVVRRCYPAMKHDGGDVIHPRDCVLLKSGPRKTDLPFVAKVAALWENPIDGEMMFSLLWYYRPEHTELGRQPEDMSDEIFASKHRDCNSVATIEDRCFVLTLNEYCRYKKRLKQLEEGISAHVPLVPLSNNQPTNNIAADIAMAVWSNLQGEPQQEREQQQRRVPSGRVSPDVVFFCRKVYDFRQKRMLKNPN